jgi:nicotinate-nucleotide pyrophosphorylase (carboxylating)
VSNLPDIIQLALDEDIGSGDITTRCFTNPDRTIEASIVAREACVLAGSAVAVEVFRRVDASLKVSDTLEDGSLLHAGYVAMRVEGRLASILTAERTALNFLQRLSGVATLTRQYVDAVRGTGAVILDTRKTTPGFRLLEKAAVAAGGGTNHRVGLYDMALVKDNHLAAGVTLDDLQRSIDRAKAAGVRVEIEADTLDQVRGFLTLKGVDVILLDNMPPDVLRQAVALRPPGLKMEASGGVNLKTVRAVAETGVDFISVGAITHSAVAVDLALDIG